MVNFRDNFFGVAESGDDFTKFSTIYQWFQTLIHALIQQRHYSYIILRTTKRVAPI
ncbi:NADH:flavin oxidoreductases, Old Yellow Enzyme family [Richelia intracellularis]|nr:NADH:flavin oxidoreductases, Old Yellow Enzyme family [Richelia intracellularis]